MIKSAEHLSISRHVHPPRLSGLIRFVVSTLCSAFKRSSTMGPAPLNVPASPIPNKTPKASGSNVNGATKQPTAAKNLAPSDISSPHELTAFVRLYHFLSRFEYVR